MECVVYKWYINGIAQGVSRRDKNLPAIVSINDSIAHRNIENRIRFSLSFVCFGFRKLFVFRCSKLNEGADNTVDNFIFPVKWQICCSKILTNIIAQQVFSFNYNFPNCEHFSVSEILAMLAITFFPKRQQLYFPNISNYNFQNVYNVPNGYHCKIPTC